MTTPPTADVVELLARAICGKNCDMPKCSCQPANSRADCRLLSMRQASAALSALDAAGRAIVPKEPTTAQVDAMHKEVTDLGRHYHRILYRTAVAAAPKVLP